MEKLRPEQRKLWRRTFLDWQAQGADAVRCAKNADEAVALWESRGAFDEETSVPLPITDSVSWRVVADVLKEHPDVHSAVLAALRSVDARKRAALAIEDDLAAMRAKDAEDAAKLQQLKADRDALKNAIDRLSNKMTFDVSVITGPDPTA